LPKFVHSYHFHNDLCSQMNLCNYSCIVHFDWALAKDDPLDGDDDDGGGVAACDEHHLVLGGVDEVTEHLGQGE